MNPEEFIKMMNDLPDEIIDSANDSRFKHHRKIWYIAPTIAACFVAILMAAIYPKIRIQTPDIRSDIVISNDTTPSITNSTVSSYDSIPTTSTESEISESSATNLSSESSSKVETTLSSVSTVNVVTGTKISLEEITTIVATTESETAQITEMYTTDATVFSMNTSHVSIHSETSTISTLSDQSVISTSLTSESPIEYNEIKYYKDIGMLPTTLADDVMETYAFDLYDADVPPWILDEYDHLSSIDFDEFDLLLVSIYTKSEDISIVGGSLFLDSMKLALCVNSLMPNDDLPCNLYLFFLQIPKGVLTGQFEYTVDFQYQDAADYSREPSVGTIYVKRVITGDDDK